MAAAQTGATAARGGLDPATAPFRAVALGPRATRCARRPDGSLILTSTAALEPYPAKITDRLVDAAGRHPDRVFLAAREAGFVTGQVLVVDGGMASVM